MKLRFDPFLNYQQDAINSIVNLFKNQEFRSDNIPIFSDSAVIQNHLDLLPQVIHENLRNIQKENGIAISESLDGMDFTVEMETGTGKTYVYLRTILELNKKYGFKKFIIITPSIAIKEGVIKTLKITSKHFKEFYQQLPYSFVEYNSAKMNMISQFSRSNKVEILIITIDSFNKDSNLMNTYIDKLNGQKPIELVNKTHPIVIIDEPQNMESDKAKQAIKNLNPLFTIRYSATHRNYYNLVYRLTPIDAFNKNLVKKIEVASVVKDDDFNKPYIKCLEIKADSKGIKSKLQVNKKLKTGFKLSDIIVKMKDNLEGKTKSIEYSGYVVSKIDARDNFIKFSNGIIIELGNEIGGNREEIMKIQIEQTIEEHFRKNKKLKPFGIKILSLFFIDRVDNYSNDNGIIRKYFIDAFNRIKKDFEEYKDRDVASIHTGYFSRRNTKSMEEDREVFNLIMRDKERLLSFEEPVEFIFSHSALREGWDNPNVFNICTLNYTLSNIKKRQEIGRGLRLPVNQHGDRILSSRNNILTVIANESYKEYVFKLQNEYIDEYGKEINFPKPQNAKNRIDLKLKKDYQVQNNFIDLWKKLSKKTKYFVNIDTDILIQQCIEEINKRISVDEIEIRIEKVSIKYENEQQLGYQYVGNEFKKFQRNPSIPNIIHYLSQETNLTYKTIVKILTKINNIHIIFNDPQNYISQVISIINEKLAELRVNKINYIETNEHFELDQFIDLPTYSDNIVKVNKGIYDGIIYDSKVEESFALCLDQMHKVNLFLKLPDWYKVKTPIGDYNPDWAIIVRSNDQFGELKNIIHLVTETKGTADEENLRPSERRRIECAKKHFESIKIDYKVMKDCQEIQQL